VELTCTLAFGKSVVNMVRTGLEVSQWCNLGFKSSGVLHCVAGLVISDVSKESTVFEKSGTCITSQKT
jgi:hypothetical protein